MSDDIDFSEVQRTLHELFKYVFITNCELDDENVTNDELQTLEELDALEVLENFKDIAVDLLNFKRDHKQTDQFELIKRCQQFEQMLQKLEAEVRNHIRVEHQLKIHLDSSQAKTDELLKDQSKNLQLIEELKRKLAEAGIRSSINTQPASPSPISEYHTYQELQKENSRDNNSSSHYKKKLSKIQDLADRRQRVLEKLEHECMKLRQQVEERDKENLKLKEDNQKLSMEQEKLSIQVRLLKDRRSESRASTDFDMIKRKIEEKSTEIGKLQNKMRVKPNGKTPVPQRQRNRADYARRSLGDFEFMKKSESWAIKKEQQVLGNKSQVKAGVKRRARKIVRGHARSSSETSKPNSYRK